MAEKLRTRTGKDELNERQKIFCHEYIVDFNAARAARSAGFSMPKQYGNRLLGLPKIQEHLAKLIEERKQKIVAKSDGILERLVQGLQTDLSDFCTWNSGGVELKDVSEVPKEKLWFIQELSENVGDKNMSRKIKLVDRVKLLELFGKHTDVQAWKEKVEHSGDEQNPLQMKCIVEDYRSGNDD